MYKSQFSHLVVSGCSFTHNNHHTPCSWPNTLAAWSGMTIDNLAVPGAGNTHIKNSVILHLETTRPDPNKTLIMVMWSGPERIDWITDKTNSNFGNQYPFTYEYTKNNELTLGGNWWSAQPKNHLIQTMVEYSKYQSHSSLALHSWIQMQDLENYLKCNNYTYYFMSWFNYSDPVDNRNRWIEFDRELAAMNLARTTDHWLVKNVDHSLGRWIEDRPEYLIDNGSHAGWPGHEAWLRSVLIPELIEKNILNEHPTQ